MMTTWKPTTLSELQAILSEDLSRCTPEQRRLWESCSVTPRLVPIVRYGSQEQVFVVAERQREAIYWEDVEQGFNISPLGSNGDILEHWCNQDELAFALDRWLHRIQGPK